MSEDSSVPLTAEERVELERLRAEKARRERRELRRLREERQGAAGEYIPDAGEDASRPVRAPSQARPDVASKARAGEDGPDAETIESPQRRTFGQRMVLPGGSDEDGVPSMPPAQRIIIGVCLLCVIVALVWIAMSNAGII